MRAEGPDSGKDNTMKPKPRIRPRAGRSRIGAPRTWADAVRVFLDHHRTRRRSELTLRWYRADLDLFAAWFKESRGEEPALAAIDAEALLDFQEHLAGKVIEGKGGATGRKLKRKPKPATINRRLSAVKSLVTWGVRNGFREEVPDPPPNLAMPPRVIKSLDPARQRKLLKEIERRNDHRTRAIVLILLHTGMRVAEACALTWSSVDLTRGKSAVTIAGKGGKVRTVELSREGRAAFADLRKRTLADFGPDHVGGLDPVLVSARRDAAGGP